LPFNFFNINSQFLMHEMKKISLRCDHVKNLPSFLLRTLNFNNFSNRLCNYSKFVVSLSRLRLILLLIRGWSLWLTLWLLENCERNKKTCGIICKIANFIYCLLSLWKIITIYINLKLLTTSVQCMMVKYDLKYFN